MLEEYALELEPEEEKESKMRIKIELQKVFDKGIAFRVLKQNDSLRADRDAPLEFIASNGIKIMSVVLPAINQQKVYLRGANKTEDEKESSFFADSEKNRDEYYDKILAAFREFADRGYFGGSEEEEIRPENENNVYEF